MARSPARRTPTFTETDGTGAGRSKPDLVAKADTNGTSYATPVVWEVGGRKQVVVSGTLRAAGYDFDTGKEVWTVRGLARIVNMTPTVGPDGTLYLPAWAPGGDGQQIVFQSAGIGRNTHGAAVALSSYAIQKVDLDTGKFETLAEDEAYDYLLPRPAADGSLYYIRRPYKPEGHVEVSPWKLALDIVLFPFRLARALALFLNFFSMMWSQIGSAGVMKCRPTAEAGTSYSLFHQRPRPPLPSRRQPWRGFRG